MDKMTFYFREAQSDVVGMKLLADYGAGMPVQLDYFIGAADDVDLIDQFLSAPGRPGLTSWAAGDFVVNLNVTTLVNAVYAVELFRAAADGTDIASIGNAGLLPPYLSTLGFLSATINLAAALPVSATDRLKMKVYMGNPTPIVPADSSFSLLASSSNLVTPFDFDNRGVHQPGQQRGRFLGKLFRKAEPRPDADGFFPTGVI